MGDIRGEIHISIDSMAEVRVQATGVAVQRLYAYALLEVAKDVMRAQTEEAPRRVQPVTFSTS
jgi:hypothetical protein